MDSLGFVFGIMGFIFSLSALTNASAAANKISKLEQRLIDAGLLTEEQIDADPPEPSQ